MDQYSNNTSGYRYNGYSQQQVPHYPTPQPSVAPLRPLQSERIELDPRFAYHPDIHYRTQGPSHFATPPPYYPAWNGQPNRYNIPGMSGPHPLTREFMDEMEAEEAALRPLFADAPAPNQNISGFGVPERDDFNWGLYGAADLATAYNFVGGSHVRVIGIPDRLKVQNLLDALNKKIITAGEILNKTGTSHARTMTATPFTLEAYCNKSTSFSTGTHNNMETSLSLNIYDKDVKIVCKDGFATNMPKVDQINVLDYSADACQVASDLSVPAHVADSKVKSNTPDNVAESLDKFTSRAFSEFVIDKIKSYLSIPGGTVKGPTFAGVMYQQIYTMGGLGAMSRKLAELQPPSYAAGSYNQLKRTGRTRIIPALRYCTDSVLYKFASDISTLVGGFGNSGGQWADMHVDGIPFDPDRRVFVNLLRDMSVLPYTDIFKFAMDTKDDKKAKYLHYNLTNWLATFVEKLSVDARVEYLRAVRDQDSGYLTATEEERATWADRIPPIVVSYLSESSPSNANIVNTVYKNGGVIAVFEFSDLRDWCYIKPVGHNAPTTDAKEEVSIENFNQSIIGMCDKIKRIRPKHFCLVVPSIYARGTVEQLTDWKVKYGMSSNGHRNQILMTSFDHDTVIPAIGIHTIVRFQMLFAASYRFSRLTWKHAIPLLRKHIANGTAGYLDFEGARERSRDALRHIARNSEQFLHYYPNPKFYVISKKSADMYGYEITPDMVMTDDAYEAAMADVSRDISRAAAEDSAMIRESEKEKKVDAPPKFDPPIKAEEEDVRFQYPNNGINTDAAFNNDEFLSDSDEP